MFNKEPKIWTSGLKLRVVSCKNVKTNCKKNNVFLIFYFFDFSPIGDGLRSCGAPGVQFLGPLLFEYKRVKILKNDTRMPSAEVRKYENLRHFYFLSLRLCLGMVYFVIVFNFDLKFKWPTRAFRNNDWAFNYLQQKTLVK